MLVPLATATAAGATPAKSLRFEPVMTAEAQSKTLCESGANRIFVSYEIGTECIAFFATSGHESQRTAVVFLDGDTTVERFHDTEAMSASLTNGKRLLQSWADKLKVRYVFLSRVGVNGSSGNHGDRRKPNETLAMNAALDIIKERLGLDTVVLAGQSGGSTIAASLLTFGRVDIRCAVLGSGAYELVELRHADLLREGRKVAKPALAKAMYDPSAHVDGIRRDPSRRIFVLGDARDTRTPFAQQQRFAEAINQRGHHAVAVRIEAGGENDHLAAKSTIPAAGACLKGATDDDIVEALTPRPRTASSALLAPR